jgi:hypothetical protein
MGAGFGRPGRRLEAVPQPSLPRSPAGALDGTGTFGYTQGFCPVRNPPLCGSGGTGRRASLRSLWASARGGSNPPFRTIDSAIGTPLDLPLIPPAQLELLAAEARTAPDCHRLRFTETTAGLKHQRGRGALLTASFRYDDLEQVMEHSRRQASACQGLDLPPLLSHSVSRRVHPFRSADFQIQPAVRLGRHQVIVGQQVLSMSRSVCSKMLRS